MLYNTNNETVTKDEMRRCDNDFKFEFFMLLLTFCENFEFEFDELFAFVIEADVELKIVFSLCEEDIDAFSCI